MKAQERIRNANILLITIKALGGEIAKNLVLAGIGSLTVIDHEIVTEADLGAQFFLEASHVGLNRAVAARAAIQQLNPRVRVNVDTVDIRLKQPSFYSAFDIIIATDLDSNALEIINTATRFSRRRFYAASSVGIYGFLFADLIEHDYVIERARSNVPTTPGRETSTRSVVSVTPKPGDDKTELVTKRELYSTWLLASDAKLPAEVVRSARRRRVVTPILSCLRALWAFTGVHLRPPNPNNHADLAQFTLLCSDKHKALELPPETLRSEVLRSFLQNVGSEVAPVAAVLGGQLAQDVINVLGGTQQPIQNFVIFDGGAMEATQYALHPDGIELGSKLLSSADVDMANGLDANTAAAMGMGMFGPISVPLVDASQVISLD
jgi:ubiquitin-like 1-activating enzyme E1 A